MDYGDLINAMREAPDTAPARLAFSAGILLCGRIKRYIEMSNASGQKLNAWCSSGWFERDWIVRGNVQDLRSFVRWLECLRPRA